MQDNTRTTDSRFAVIGLSPQHGLPNGVIAAALAGMPAGAVVDADLGRLETAAQRLVELGHPRPSRYMDVNEMLRDYGPNRVAIIVPTRYHAEVAIDALNAGADVMIEKPFATSAREAEQVLAVAKRRRRAVMVGLQKPFSVAESIAAIRGGAIGSLRHITSSWVRPRNGMPPASFYTAPMGQGATADLGVHQAGLVMELVRSRPILVSTFASNVLGWSQFGDQFTADDSSQTQITFEEGVVASLDCHWAEHVDRERHEITLYGSVGTAHFAVPGPEKSTRGMEGWIHTSSGRRSLPAPKTTQQAHVLKWGRFAAVCDRVMPAPTPDELLRLQLVIDGMQLSAAGRGRQVRVPF